MNFVDLEKVKVNSGGDQDLQMELLNMGLERINASLAEMDSMTAGQDWDSLSRSIHKLRPILVYAGIESFNDELVALEKDTKLKTGLADVPARIGKMIENMKQARNELEQVIAGIQK